MYTSDEKLIINFMVHFIDSYGIMISQVKESFVEIGFSVKRIDELEQVAYEIINEKLSDL